MAARLLCLLLGGALALTAAAHGDLHERIARLDARLQREPGQARLWLERGELHRQHRDFAAAERDLAEAARLDPRLPGLEPARARLLAESGREGEALALLERLCAQPPAPLEWQRLRARLLQSQGRPAEAAKAWEGIVGGPGRPQPSDVLELAALRARLGEIDAAVTALEDGLRRLGELPVLELRLVELLTATGRYELALARIESARSRAPRPETWLERKAEVLRLAGRLEEAAEAARAGLAALESLPEVRRDTAAARELASRLRRYLLP